MANEIATKAQLVAGAPLSAIMPRTVEDVYRLATAVYASGMVPAALLDQSKEKSLSRITVAILTGLELGLSPMRSLHSIAVINGAPTIYGAAAMALMWSTGLVKDYQEEVTNGVAKVSITRRGSASPITASFSLDDATTAGLLPARPGTPWQKYTRDMLLWKARHRVISAAVPECLYGMQLQEVESTPVTDSAPIAPQATVGDRTSSDALYVVKQAAKECGLREAREIVDGLEEPDKSHVEENWESVEEAANE